MKLLKDKGKLKEGDLVLLNGFGSDEPDAVVIARITYVGKEERLMKRYPGDKICKGGPFFVSLYTNKEEKWGNGSIECALFGSVSWRAVYLIEEDEVERIRFSNEL